MNHPNEPEPLIHLNDLRMVRAAAIWRAQLVISAHGPLAEGFNAGDAETVLGVLQALADEAYKRGMMDHQKTVLDALGESEAG